MTNLREYVRLHKKWSVIAGIVIVILFVLYGCFYNSIGMRFDDTFFSMKGGSGSTFYSGVTRRGKINITVSDPKSSITTVTYQLEDYSKKTYLVSLEPGDEKTSREVIITNENGAKIFKGTWSNGYLTNENGEVVFDQRIKVDTTQGVLDDDDSGENLTATEIIRMSLHDYDTLRGRPQFFAMGMIILLLAVFDMMYPLAFFNFSHMLWVDEARPSDTYLSLQKAKWIILPLVSFVLFIIALS